jgi:hypothetical protein
VVSVLTGIVLPLGKVQQELAGPDLVKNGMVLMIIWPVVAGVLLGYSDWVTFKIKGHFSKTTLTVIRDSD